MTSSRGTGSATTGHIAIGAARGTSPANVVMACSRAFPDLGGVESHVDTLAPLLVERGFAVSVETTDVTGRLPRVTRRNLVTICRSRAFPAKKDYYFSPGLFLRLLTSKFAILHVQGVHALVPPIAMAAAIARRRPFVITFHTGGATNEFRSRMRRTQFWLLAPLLRRAAAWIAVSEHEAELFHEVIGVPRDKITVIRNGGVLPGASAGVEPDPDLIVSSGRLERYKGHHRAIAAIAEMVATRPGIRLRILGSGPYEQELRQLSRELGVSDRVEFDLVPPQERQRMADEIARAGVVVLLSDYEAHPVAVMEALALRRPVIVLDNSGMSELVRSGLTRGLPADADATAIAAAIGEELTNTAAPAGKPDLPNWDQCAAEVEKVYRRVLAAQ